MRFRFIAVSSLLVSYLMVGGIPNLGQVRPSEMHGPDMQEKRLLVNLVRVINTAQMTYRDTEGGSFAEWNALVASQGFKKAIDQFSRSSPRLKDLNFGAPTEIVSGWRLRLTVSQDKKSYSIALTSKSDKECSYSVVSDDEGSIREARIIGCSESSKAATVPARASQ
jgi:hypothetical protein